MWYIVLFVSGNTNRCVRQVAYSGFGKTLFARATLPEICGVEHVHSVHLRVYIYTWKSDTSSCFWQLRLYTYLKGHNSYECVFVGISMCFCLWADLCPLTLSLCQRKGNDKLGPAVT